MKITAKQVRDAHMIYFGQEGYFENMADRLNALSEPELSPLQSKLKDEGWTPWFGGECPVPKDVQVDYVVRGGGQLNDVRAGIICWHDKFEKGSIIAYRLAPASDIPEGWRELREEEKNGEWRAGAKYFHQPSGEWRFNPDYTCGANTRKDNRIIVPIEPDPYAELKKAHAAGKVIEARYKNGNEWHTIGTVPSWILPVDCYRIRPWTLGRTVNGHTLPDGAEWMNGELFTEDMLTPIDGKPSRPMMKGEFPLIGDEYSSPDRDPWIKQIWNSLVSVDDYSGLLHRTNRPIPSKPAMGLWDCPEDVPGPVCWIRSTAGASFGTGKDERPDSMHLMIVTVSVQSMTYIDTDFRHVLWSDKSKIAKLEHSTDRKTWFPCTKEAK